MDINKILSNMDINKNSILHDRESQKEKWSDIEKIFHSI